MDFRRLDHSLACLTHPTSLACIALLILNDHWLKQLVPSALTGKLSDFAGLYFFPYLLSVPLSLISLKREKNSRAIGAIPFLATGLVFALIKTSTWANIAVEEVIQRVTGLPSAILIDPSDLFALLVLAPSWLLWHQELPPAKSRLSWVAVVAASLATTATSCAPIDTITTLIVDHGAVNAYSSDGHVVAATFDEGASWENFDRSPEGIPTIPALRELPYSVCPPGSSTECFRIAGEDVVEQSNDAGKTWQVAWHLPAGRRQFMDRLASGVICGKPIDLGPYDLAIVGGTHDFRVIAAMGNEGVIVRDAFGNWERRQVGSARPTPFYATDIITLPWVLKSETVLLVELSALGWFLLNVLYWAPALRRVHQYLPVNRRSSWILAPLGISLGGSLMAAAALGIAYARDLPVPVPAILAVLTLIIPLLGYIASANRLRASVGNPSGTEKALRAIVLGPFAMLVGGILPFGIWAFGVIPFYSMAATLSATLFVTAAALFARSLTRRASEVSPIGPNPRI